MIITQKELFDSKKYVNGAIHFDNPESYLMPFIEKIDKLNPIWEFEAQEGSVNANDDDTQNKSYSRVIAKAKLPQNYDINIEGLNSFNHLVKEMGIVYALDTQKPEMKVYTGNRVSTCMNQCIFGADSIDTALLTTGTIKLENTVGRYVHGIEETLEQERRLINMLNESIYEGEKYNEKVGELMLKTARSAKLGSTTITAVLKHLTNPKSIYYPKDNTTTGWNLYNVYTEVLKKSNIADEASKVFLLQNVFSLN